MKKTLLHAAILAGLTAAGSAQAVHVNPDGLGQVLLYPYYTVQNGFDTYVHVVNTTAAVKAVKVRFLEGKNSQEVLDFNLYLSPHDEWAGVVTKTATGAKLVSLDTSCVAPASLENGIDFRNFQYSGDTLNTLERSREGYIEVIEMGEIVDPVLAAAATHTSAGVPANCAAIRTAAKTGGVLNDNDPAVIDAPAGGLYGFNSLINVAGGMKSSVDATALDNFVTAGAIHYNPGTTSPSLEQGDTDADILDAAGVITFAGANPIDNVSAVLMRDTVANDYVVDAGRDSKTDWVVTFPTKRFYVNAAVVSAPFSRVWNKVAGTSCDDIGITYYDREEKNHIVTVDEDFSPKPPTVLESNQLCNEVNTLTVKPHLAGSSYVGLFGAEYTDASFSLASGFSYGWMYIDLTHAADAGATPAIPASVLSDGTTDLNGLPVIGFAAISNSNGTMEVGGVNVLSNYMGTTAHKSTRDITTP